MWDYNEESRAEALSYAKARENHDLEEKIRQGKPLPNCANCEMCNNFTGKWFERPCWKEFFDQRK